jgi:hypothetical protein
MALSVGPQMMESAHAHGLGPYLSAIRPFHIVDHDNCAYEAGGVSGEQARTGFRRRPPAMDAAVDR